MHNNVLRLVCAAAAILALAALPVPASATLLSTIISGSGTVTSGDLVFSNFTYSNTGDMPSDSVVDVETYVDGAGDVGLRFTGPFLDFIGGSGSDAFINFTVTETNVNKLISGASLAGDPTVVGGPTAAGIASVTETFQPTDPLVLNIYAIANPPTPYSQQLSDSGSFSMTHTQVFVQKDALAFSANSTGVPELSFITQTFHEVNNSIPEPGSILLLGMGMLGLALARRRRK